MEIRSHINNNDDAEFWKKLYNDELEQVSNERKHWVLEKAALTAERDRLKLENERLLNISLAQGSQA